MCSGNFCCNTERTLNLGTPGFLIWCVTLFVRHTLFLLFYFRPVLIQLLSAITRKTLHTIRSAPVPSAHSDLVATSFQAYSQLLKRHPDYFTAAEEGGVDPRALFDCACFTLHLPESSAAKYSASFLTCLLAVGAAQTVTNPVLDAVVREGGLALLKSAVSRAVTSSSSSNYLEFAADILFSLAKYYFTHLTKWLDAMVKDDLFPSPCVPKEKKVAFAMRLLKEKGHKRKIQEVTKEFALTCQVLQKTLKQ